MTTPKQIPFSKEQLQEIFEYRDGHLYWLLGGTGRRPNRLAGSKKSRDYIDIGLQGIVYRAHRLIWIYHYNEQPKELDHINRNKSDNRIENLRLVTRSENLHNATAKRGNKGGCVGVNWNNNKQYWQASICINYKHDYLGSSKDYFEVCCLRKSAENRML